MKIVGDERVGIRVVELDPSKKYWLVISRSSPLVQHLHRITGEDGMILVANPGEVSFVEHEGSILGAKEDAS